MGFVFPRAMPLVGPGRQRFELSRVDLSTREASGRQGSVGVGMPLWAADWTLGTITAAQSSEWRAWVDSLDGSARLFLGRDVERPYPRLHAAGFAGMSRAGGGAFDGSAASWSQSIASDGQATLTLTGLPAALKLSQGDYFDFRWTTLSEARRSLVRSLENATASGGGSVSLAIRPPVPALTPSGAVAHLDNPACLMRLSPEQTQIGEMDRRQRVSGRIVALQDLLP